MGGEPVTDCFIHASDLHLDAPLGSTGRLDADIRNRLAVEARGAWDALIDLTIRREASFLVLAGDVFHDGVAHPAVQRRFHEGLRRLNDEDIKVFVCHGNHDPLTTEPGLIGRLPGNVTVFPTDEPSPVEVNLRSGSTAYVSGLSFSDRRVSENLAGRFTALEPTSGPHVAVLHANLDGDEGHDPYAPCSLHDLRAAPVQYWALGHIHLRRILGPEQLGDGRYGGYCGNLQGRSFKPAECHPKGALVVPIQGGRIGQPEFEECDRIRFIHDDIEVEPTDDLEMILDRISATARSSAASATPRPVVWSFTLTGRHPDPGQIQALFADDDAELGRDVFADLPGILNDGGLAESEMRVARHRTREDLIADGGFRAAVLETLDGETTRSALEQLITVLPTGIPRAAHEGDDGDAGLERKAVVDRITTLAEEILVSELGDSDA